MRGGRRSSRGLRVSFELRWGTKRQGRGKSGSARLKEEGSWEEKRTENTKDVAPCVGVGAGRPYGLFPRRAGR